MERGSGLHREGENIEQRTEVGQGTGDWEEGELWRREQRLRYPLPVRETEA